MTKITLYQEKIANEYIESAKGDSKDEAERYCCWLAQAMIEQCFRIGELKSEDWFRDYCYNNIISKFGLQAYIYQRNGFYIFEITDSIINSPSTFL